MRHGWSLKEHNEGASLIAVLTTIVFVTAIATIVLNVTITNIRMRQVEEAGKRNFYSAEEIIDELSVNLNNVAAGAMQKAYMDVLTQYLNITESGTDVQDKFMRLYMKNLENEFWDQNGGTRRYRKIQYEDGVEDADEDEDEDRMIYVWGYYLQTKVSDLMPEDTEDFFVSPDPDAVFTIDYVEGLFTLKNVKIEYIDEQGYTTTISTDMVFHTPVMNFSGSHKVMEYMKYAMIADERIHVFGSTGVKVNGSVYAGYDGILIDSNSEVSFVGNNIVTRGDIEVAAGADATFGDLGSRIWAENVVTSGSGSASHLTMNGNIYVADDLTLNGNSQEAAVNTVTLNGNYYGYNFLERYDGTIDPESDAYQYRGSQAQFSSAIVINGRNNRLDMSGLKYLLLAGRTYISRGSSSSDLMMGESLSVRTNQLAYYVPERFLTKTPVYDDATGDLTGYTNVDFDPAGLVEYSNNVGVNNLKEDYLNTSKPIAVYCYKYRGEYYFRFYLNFDSKQKANDFFNAYWNANKNSLGSYAQEYADAIILPEERLYTLNGDIMYRAEGAGADEDSYGFMVEQVVISSEDWQPKAEGQEAGIYYSYADKLAINYKSLQTYLEDDHPGITSADVRFYDTDYNTEFFPQINKQIEPLTGNLIDMSKIPDAVYDNSSTVTGGADDKLIAIVNNSAGYGNAYKIRDGWMQGIVIATGDVIVPHDFTGMIISGGIIRIENDGVKVTADEIMVSEMFEEDKESADPIFADLFKDFNTLDQGVIGMVRVDDYLTYENWTRTDY